MFEYISSKLYYQDFQKLFRSQMGKFYILPWHWLPKGVESLRVTHSSIQVQDPLSSSHTPFFGKHGHTRKNMI